MAGPLPDSLVIEIHSMCKTASCAEVARKLNVSTSVAFQISRAKSYKHLGLERVKKSTLGWLERGIGIRARILNATELDMVSGCWIWKRNKNNFGYGSIYTGNRCDPAHRASYEEFIGPIQKGMHVCHKCDNPACVNPDHLFLGSPAENMKDRDSKGRQSRGSSHAPSILNEEKVIEIMKLLNDGKRPFEIAKLFGVRRSVIYHIKIGRTWHHVTGLPSSRTQHPGW